MLFKETKFPVLKQPKVAFLKGARLPVSQAFFDKRRAPMLL
jgi:hypothetical protein